MTGNAVDQDSLRAAALATLCIVPFMAALSHASSSLARRAKGPTLLPSVSAEEANRIAALRAEKNLSPLEGAATASLVEHQGRSAWRISWKTISYVVDGETGEIVSLSSETIITASSNL